jgi:hypothetical protein
MQGNWAGFAQSVVRNTEPDEMSSSNVAQSLRSTLLRRIDDFSMSLDDCRRASFLATRAQPRLSRSFALPGMPSSEPTGRAKLRPSRVPPWLVRTLVFGRNHARPFRVVGPLATLRPSKIARAPARRSKIARRCRRLQPRRVCDLRRSHDRGSSAIRTMDVTGKCECDHRALQRCHQHNIDCSLILKIARSLRVTSMNNGGERRRRDP